MSDNDPAFDPRRSPSAPTEPEGAPPGVHTMAVLRWLLIGLMAIVAVASVAYSFGLLPTGSASATPAGQYYCPMHPQIVQDGPGECPICSMSLVPKTDAPGKSANEDAATAPPSPTVVANSGVPGLVPIELSLDRVQLIGVRTAPATTESLVSELRTVAFISADEARLARVHARFSGWIEHLAVATTGQDVHQGQVLASIYNLELLPPQQEFLTALRWGTSTPASQSGFGRRLEQDARHRLELLGMSPAEIDRIAATGKVSRTIDLIAPRSGSVTQKSATQGGYIQPGTALFEIADLSRVWALADVYEYESGRVEIGQRTSLELAAYPGQRFTGDVGLLYPAVDPTTRTLRVRVELDNRKRLLRPGMYGELVIELEQAQGTVVPRDALVDTGDHQYVFVANVPGKFEPRRVTAGARSGDKVQILTGLAPGELVVTTGNFLIDSESRLRAAIEGGR